ncbi:PqqD family protein [Paenibacillus rubinfantis]|uniref:PqqD family protein n=1 Tax=Paenibacillus rubinfantis TaxID=1720296 RepID=UPI00073EE22E|nr:PqqD family protein [Paenibacillus rubinfantis]
MRKKRRSTQAPELNLLEMVPRLRTHLNVATGEDGAAELLLPRRSWLERQSVRFLKQPAVIHVHLDELGSEVVTRCTGAYTVGDIADAIRTKFGEAAEPLMPRLSKFIEILEANDWLIWEEAVNPRLAQQESV